MYGGIELISQSPYGNREMERLQRRPFLYIIASCMRCARVGGSVRCTFGFAKVGNFYRWAKTLTLKNALR